MSFDFSNDESKKVYLNQCGLHQGADFVSLTYKAEPNYECFEIILNVDGREFNDKTFGTTIESVYPKNIYKNGSIVGTESKEEAYRREFKEKYFKLLHLVTCFVPEQQAKEIMGKFDSLKDLVDKANSIIEGIENKPKLNFLTVWKNNDSKQKSFLILPERIQWVEIAKYNAAGQVLPAAIKLTNWQQTNQTIEKYPYGAASNESTDSSDVILNDISGDDGDLPF